MSRPLFPDVVVNGETLPASVIAAEAQNHSAPRSKPGLAWRKAANAVALRTLLLQEARRRELKAAPRSVGPDQTETEDEALIRTLLDDCVTPQVPTRQEVHKEWSRDPSRFRAPSLWEASHILIACDPNDPADQKTARDRAEAIARSLAANPAQFRDLAKSSSDCGSSAAGGSLAQISPGDTVPEFEAALRQLKGGETTENPVLTRFGWHIIRLDAHLPGEVLPFESARKKIAEAMEKAAWMRAARVFIEDLVATAEVSGAKL